MKYGRFGLVLMLNHACNLRCSYCYTGKKFNRAMPADLGRRAIDRAMASLRDSGTLELGFFGGEPLIEAELLQTLLAYGRERCNQTGRELTANVTTNGTLSSGAAWDVLTDPALEITLSHDGLPEVHDRHRLHVDGSGSSHLVLETLRRLFDAGREVRVIVVVRPDTVSKLACGIEHLFSLGVRQLELSLDLWARWTLGDVENLKRAVAECARIWRRGLPVCSIGCFDEKAAMLAALPMGETARCGFGDGEIAVAPSGNMYPCERLIGDDEEHNPARLAGHVMDESSDFQMFSTVALRRDDACDECSMQAMCNTTCRCSNFVRTGNVSHPDGLLCAWNQSLLEETARIMEQLVAESGASHGIAIGETGLVLSR